jgi:serine/threonine-protein kinase
LLVEKKQRLEINDVAHIALGIARALQHLHANRFIHRDIKPDNILLSPYGEPKLIDLGLAKWEKKGGEPLTATSDGFGTSYYMPFEQSLNAHFVDARSDIFALGATLYHLLAGRVPFAGEDHHEVMRMKKAGHYTPVSMLNPNVPASLEAIINRMLALDPRQRYRTATDLIDALESADLTNGLPSYADLGLAVRDPDSGEKDKDEPTRPDLRLRRSNLKRSQSLAEWVLKYKSSRGGWKTRRASTEQVLNALRAKRFSGPVLAARQLGHRFRPLGQFPEFHVYFASPDVRPPEPAAPEPSQSGFCRRVLAKIGLGHI